MIRVTLFRSKELESEFNLYLGSITHIRKKPKIHRFLYKAFFIHANLKYFENIKKYNLLFNYNRPSIFSFYDIDHGLRDGSSTFNWFVDLLKQNGISFDGKVYVSCFPRVFGYVFNPITIYFYFNKNNSLRVIVYEVKNTFGDQHCYLIKVNSKSNILSHSCMKKMIVSPFNPIDHKYDFKIIIPEEKFFIRIDELEKEEKILSAYFEGKRKKFSVINLIICIFLYPLMTIKVIFAIHYEAFRLFLKGIPVSPEIPKIKNKTVAISISLFLSIFKVFLPKNK
ncbi:MAG: hypothetical protein CFH01_00260 [Alphaproteobacteria bacterium MarineAlpha2_Bin1]|nr:MAG: hypothetical protein CFH01_00260 [Alphaproteobacteria bacterium MarineAlpha2_Bin1]|tara:strand:+ start:615 stop:1460 length:846 start_codon:yes stop_codon:yes gene_type:complete